VGLLGITGSWLAAALMAACTSRAAALMSRLSANWMVTLTEPRLLEEVIFANAGDAAELAF